MKYVLFSPLLFLLASCAQLNQLMQDNELLSYIAIKNSVAQYIDKTSNGNREVQRTKAQRFMKGADIAEGYLSTNPTAEFGNVLDIVKAQIDFSKMSIADRLLIDDLFLVIKMSMDQQKSEKNIPDDYIVNLNKVIQAVRDGAKFYL